MTYKQQVRKIIDDLADNCTIEDVQHQLYLIEKINKGLKSIDKGRGIPHKDVRKQFALWRNK